MYQEEFPVVLAGALHTDSGEGCLVPEDGLGGVWRMEI